MPGWNYKAKVGVTIPSFLHVFLRIKLLLKISKNSTILFIKESYFLKLYVCPS